MVQELPSAYKAAKKHDANLPTFSEAIHGEHSIEYEEAMNVEMGALENTRTWTEVPRSSVPRGTKILPLTWVFKLKQYPDGQPWKFKARLCVCGDHQVEGIDYFEKYAPVVSWSTVRMLLTMTVHENLQTCMVDFINPFAQATLREDVYVELPRMYESSSGEDTVLKLNKSLYGWSKLHCVGMST